MLTMNNQLGDTNEIKNIILEHPVVSLLLVGSLLYYFFGANPLSGKEADELREKWGSDEMRNLLSGESEESAKAWDEKSKMAKKLSKRTNDKEQIEGLLEEAKHAKTMARIIRYKLKGKKDD